MRSRIRHRLALTITLCMVLQLVMPWHDWHAVASDETVAEVSMSPCHPGAVASGAAVDADQPDALASVCEWVCAQTQPVLHHALDLPARPAPYRLLIHLMSLTNLQAEAVPTPPPIA